VRAMINKLRPQMFTEAWYLDLSFKDYALDNLHDGTDRAMAEQGEMILKSDGRKQLQRVLSGQF